MKKTVVFIFQLICLPAIYFFSMACLPAGDGKTGAFPARPPLITANVSAILHCGVGNTCGTWQKKDPNTKQWHGFKITLTGFSIISYNSNFVYTIYPGPNGSGTPIASFPCTQNVVEFAGSQLADNSTYSVVIKSAVASSTGMVSFTTGSGAGKGCTYGPIGPKDPGNYNPATKQRK